MHNRANTPLLEVKDLSVAFQTYEGTVHAVNDVSFNLYDGESIAMVGESGCGKSATMFALMRLHHQSITRITASRIQFDGRDLQKLSEREMNQVRGKDIAMVFQDPMTSFNPVKTIRYQITESLKLHLGMNKTQSEDRAVELLSMVGIPDPRKRLDDYPHQFSGGMRQRAMIAMALACDPKILIADEPTTALDVTIQAQIMELVSELKDQFNMAIIWITHDLGVVANIAERVNVMYGGYIIETGTAEQIYRHPQHPYTIGLLGSLPGTTVSATANRLYSIEGIPPVLYHPAQICPFAPRCEYRIDQCLQERPPLKPHNGNEHLAACWLTVEPKGVRA
ncbi:MAG: ABC transporter ATP-binding protein [Anaerolineae bacterium]|jgi:oligopeptide/dipeptide ABC transporter ATP-binding protein|nr:ABC transporter ATP-binding protein [Anaerolineae bacterium]